jgi:hypothetical protein
MRYASPDRPIERGPVSASLSAGDYFAQYRIDHFSPEIFYPPFVNQTMAADRNCRPAFDVLPLPEFSRLSIATPGSKS